MALFAVTFMQKQPSLKDKFLEIIEINEERARDRAFCLTDGQFMTVYPWAEFYHQIATYGLTRATEVEVATACGGPFPNWRLSK